MGDIIEAKKALRERLCKVRRSQAESLEPEISALVLHRPPTPVLDLIPVDAAIGLYRASDGEAPAGGYARFFAEAGHTIALPRIANRDEPMTFHEHSDPFDESDLSQGPLGIMQPAANAPLITPNVLIVPLVGFTDNGERLGQGGGYYDRWLADHPGTLAIGIAWDSQLVAELPTQAHDMSLSMVITPTRIYGPFS